MLSNHCLAAIAKQPWCCYAWKHLLQCQHWSRVGLAGSHFVQVIWVRSVLKVIRIWPGLDHVTWDVKLRKHNVEVQQWMPQQHLFILWATPTFSMIFAGCKCTESHTPHFMYRYAWNNLFLKLAQSHAHESIAVAGLQRVLPLQSTRQRILFVACMKPLLPLQATFLCLQAFK